ncbi:hypothetical protein Tco_1060615 [Tanacetum coccineum]
MDVLDSIRVRDANMLKEASECHNVTLGYTFHSFGNVVGTIERFSNGETIEHVAKTSIRMVLDHLEGVKGSVYPFDLKGLTKRSFIEESITDQQEIVMGRNTKNMSKLLESKSDLNILDDKGDGEGTIQNLNKMDTFVEFKNEYRANLFDDVE